MKNDAVNTVTHIGAVDCLGRTPVSIEGFRSGRYVGLFYFTWFGQFDPAQKNPLDITKILKNDEDELFNIKSEKYPMEYVYHFNEPLYGYYSAKDEYIVRRHLELFICAGIDFLALDFSNAIFYRDALKVILDVYLEYQDYGFSVPKIMLFTNLKSGRMADIFYREFVSDGRYDSLWFRGSCEKPLFIGWEREISDEFKEKFTIRPPQWPNAEYIENGWPYMELGRPHPLHQNMISVSVAQLTGDAFSFSRRGVGGTVKESRGRGFTDDNPKNGNIQGIISGANFGEQWDTAIENDPEIVFVTGWNEWVAQKFAAEWSGDTPFWVDTFNTEFSRDIEMTANRTCIADGNGGYREEGYGDNYYIQLIANIRRYKGIAVSEDRRYGNKESGDFSFYNAETYLNTAVKPYGRDSYGAFGPYGCRYKQNAPKNFVKKAEVMHTEEYIGIRCILENNPEITSDSLNILFGTDNVKKNSWEGFTYRISDIKNGKADLCGVRENGRYSFEKIRGIEVMINGTEVIYKIPRKEIGADTDVFTLRFKITDSVEHPDDIMDYYVSGMSMPQGRLTYLYSAY